MRIFSLFLLVFLCSFGLSAGAETGSGPLGAKLSAADRADLQRIEAYLNQRRSMTADFLQVDDQGGMMRGTIAMLRPGKMRVSYSPPSKDFIVADGTMVHIWNEDLKSQTSVEQSGSLAEFILRDPIKLSGDVVVTGFKRYPAKIEVTLVETDDPLNGSLTLVFEDHPLLLRQWKVVDSQNRTTGVNLESVRDDVVIPASTFVFVPPDFGKGGKAR